MAIPQTSVRTSHAMTIRVDGVTIGRIQGWNPTQSRAANPVYELNAATAGAILEHVPANQAGQTITINRYDLFNVKMEQAWGPNFDITLLMDQDSALEVNEKWLNPDGTREMYVYGGFWFTSLGRTMSAVDDKIVKTNATAVYTTYRRLV